MHLVRVVSFLSLIVDSPLVTCPLHQEHLLPTASTILFRDYVPGSQPDPCPSARPASGGPDSLPDDNDCVRIGYFRIPSQDFNPWEVI
jgi:hypothetical protein